MSFAEIAETLRHADNEATAEPYWLIVDPRKYGNLKTKVDHIANCITGPFFCREDAENHLKARHYEFSSKAGVWCFSGYWSQKYKAACREIRS